MRPNQVSERSLKLKSAARIGPNGRLFFYTYDEYHCGANSLWSFLACGLFRYPASCPGLNSLLELTEFGRTGLEVQDQLNDWRHIPTANQGWLGARLSCTVFVLSGVGGRRLTGSEITPLDRTAHATKLASSRPVLLSDVKTDVLPSCVERE